MENTNGSIQVFNLFILWIIEYIWMKLCGALSNKTFN